MLIRWYVRPPRPSLRWRTGRSDLGFRLGHKSSQCAVCMRCVATMGFTPVVMQPSLQPPPLLLSRPVLRSIDLKQCVKQISASGLRCFQSSGVYSSTPPAHRGGGAGEDLITLPALVLTGLAVEEYSARPAKSTPPAVNARIGSTVSVPSGGKPPARPNEAYQGEGSTN